MCTPIISALGQKTLRAVATITEARPAGTITRLSVNILAPSMATTLWITPIIRQSTKAALRSTLITTVRTANKYGLLFTEQT